MTVGNGLLANKFMSFKDDNSIVIFASGVSNSNNLNEEAFTREKDLLIQTIKENQDKVFVYFSSCDVIYANEINKLYYFHKLEMEKLIETMIKQYYIFRLPQVIGYSKNKNSLLNFLITSIKEKKELPVWEYAYKNLIDIDDIYKLAIIIINNKTGLNKIINLINPNYYSILEIVKVIENILNINAIISMKKEGYKPNYLCDNILLNRGVSFDDNYMKESIIKHYKKLINKGAI